MISIKEAYQSALKSLSEFYSAEESKAIVNRLFEDGFKLTSKELLLNPQLPFKYEQLLNDYIKRLCVYEPVQHVLGFEWFGGLKIKVNQHVLINGFSNKRETCLCAINLAPHWVSYTCNFNNLEVSVPIILLI